MSVYFAQRAADGLIKIGCSRSVNVRMQNIRAKLIGAVPGDRAIEVLFHKRFAHLRVRGEWFKPGDDLLHYIRTEAQGHKPDTEMMPTVIRHPKSWLLRMDRVAEWMSQPGLRITRVDVLRIAIHQGLDQLEAEGKKR